MNPGPDSTNEVDRRLRDARKLPAQEFRSELRRRLVALDRAGFGRPRQLRLVIATYAGLGMALLAVAIASALGAGPLSA